jgi:hypothetical protein
MMANGRLGLIKLSPVLPDSFFRDLGSGIRFVSFGGECRETLVLLGSEAPNDVGAVHLPSGEFVLEKPVCPSTDLPMRYLYDADPAAVRAHALGTLADWYGLTALGDSPGYLTAQIAVDSVWLRRYEVLYSGKADLKATRQALRSLGATVFEVKQRGAGVDVDRLRKELQCDGRPVSLIVYLVGRSLRYVLAASG